MTRPHSTDLRERVVACVVSGETVRPVAARFSVSVASVVRWSQLYRATGSVEPGKIGGHCKPLLTGERGWLLERIEQECDVTLRQLQAELATRGIEVSYGTVWNFVHEEGLSFKKKHPAERTRPS
jgi:transposase